MKTDMLIMLGMMRAREEIPPDKADFDVMVGGPTEHNGRDDWFLSHNDAS